MRRTNRPKKLSTLLQAITPIEILNFKDVDIVDIAYDSRRCSDGTLFFAIKGFTLDGHKFVPNAVENGAAAVIVERPIPKVNVPQIVVENTRRALSAVSARFFEHPSKNLVAIGVTGTNGKTTTTFILKNIFEQQGFRCGLIGTVEYDLIVEKVEAVHTTPESRDIQEMLSKIVSGGGRAAVLEVSSHALEEYRVADVDFDIGVFTNLTRDHLDFHKTFANYRDAKAKLFRMVKSAAFNADDPNHGFFVSVFKKSRRGGRFLTYGIEDGDVRAEIIENSLSGTVIRIRGAIGGIAKLKIVGIFNVYNALAAASAALLAEIPEQTIVEGIQTVERVPGRFEVIEADGFFVIIDYAHTPDALEKLLKSVKLLNPQRIIVVFGAGGERDRGKRPLMAKAVEKFADLAVVTSDNPRSEDPKLIAAEVVSGFRVLKPLVELDRRKAIEKALNLAQEGDAVVIAGKGHERYQIIGKERIPFSDREVVMELISERSHAVS